MQVFSDMLFYILDGARLLFGHVGVRSSFPRPLSEKEEAEKIRLACEGDKEAKQQLIEHNLRLVAHIAKKYAGGNVDADDLVSVGTIGLMKAVSTFRPEVGRLTTYASRCIENEILMLLRASRKLKANVSLDEPVGADKDGNSILISDLLGTEPNALSDEAETKIESERALHFIPRLLSPREQKVICLRYGLIGGTPRPQHAVAKMLGISRSYVSRIEKKALEKLKHALAGNPNK